MSNLRVIGLLILALSLSSCKTPVFSECNYNLRPELSMCSEEDKITECKAGVLPSAYFIQLDAITASVNCKYK